MVAAILGAFPLQLTHDPISVVVRGQERGRAHSRSGPVPCSLPRPRTGEERALGSRQVPLKGAHVPVETACRRPAQQPGEDLLQTKQSQGTSVARSAGNFFLLTLLCYLIP